MADTAAKNRIRRAAGALIVEEAGGLVSDYDGRPLAYDRPCSVLARNKLADKENLNG